MKKNLVYVLSFLIVALSSCRDQIEFADMPNKKKPVGEKFDFQTTQNVQLKITTDEDRPVLSQKIQLFQDEKASKLVLDATTNEKGELETELKLPAHLNQLYAVVEENKHAVTIKDGTLVLNSTKLLYSSTSNAREQVLDYLQTEQVCSYREGYHLFRIRNTSNYMLWITVFPKGKPYDVQIYPGDTHMEVEDRPGTDHLHFQYGSGKAKSNVNIPADNKYCSTTTTVYFPSKDEYATMMFEDLWPHMGDYDFNDMFMKINYEYVKNSSGKILSTKIKTNLVYNGGRHASRGFAYEIAGSGYKVFTDANEILSHNTLGNVEFTQEHDLSSKNLTALDINFFLLDLERKTEIHLPNYPMSSAASTEVTSKLGTYDDAGNFVSHDNMPWSILVPYDVAPTKETQDIRAKYPKFEDWAKSFGATNQNWYLNAVE